MKTGNSRAQVGGSNHQDPNQAFLAMAFHEAGMTPVVSEVFIIEVIRGGAIKSRHALIKLVGTGYS